MTKDINQRLAQLRTRRTGPGSSMESRSVGDSMFSEYSSYANTTEDWETRGKEGQQWIRYALGAMAAVSETYTRVSLETGEKVVNQLNQRLSKAGLTSEFELQGSVPLDVHIKGVSDVDLLVITTTHLKYEISGSKAKQGYYIRTNTSSSEVLAKLRNQIEYELALAFPKATIDKEGAKAVKISGASLSRCVDVVPALWFDTAEYQGSGRKADRGVCIYNKRTGETIRNHPFLHIDLITKRCDTSSGGLRKSIRLCKNVKEDSDKDIQLSSFDIASLMYHADMHALSMNIYTDLAVLAETQRYLDALYHNQNQANALMVPDGSRKIFDSPEKRNGLLNLSLEIDELMGNVYQESNFGNSNQLSSIEEIRNHIKYQQIR